jgi:hypothetical protein
MVACMSSRWLLPKGLVVESISRRPVPCIARNVRIAGTSAVTTMERP